MKKFLSLFFVVLVLILSVNSCKFVDTSEVGIKFKKFSLSEQGDLKASTVTGVIFYNPFTTKVYKYPVFVQRVSYDPFTVTAKDGTVFEMDPELAYWLDRDQAIHVFQKYRKSLKGIEEGYFRTCIYDAYRITANTYASDSLMGHRGDFEAKVREMLEQSLGSEGFHVNEFTSQITPPEELKASIAAKNQAIQNALRVNNQIAEAEANAKIKVTQARGEADALKIKADAEAYYNKTIAASLSELIIREDFIEKWDGNMPTVMSSSNGMIFDLSKYVK